MFFFFFFFGGGGGGKAGLGVGDMTFWEAVATLSMNFDNPNSRKKNYLPAKGAGKTLKHQGTGQANKLTLTKYPNPGKVEVAVSEAC